MSNPNPADEVVNAGAVKSSISKIGTNKHFSGPFERFWHHLRLTLFRSQIFRTVVVCAPVSAGVFIVSYVFGYSLLLFSKLSLPPSVLLMLVSGLAALAVPLILRSVSPIQRLLFHVVGTTAVSVPLIVTSFFGGTVALVGLLDLWNVLDLNKYSSIVAVVSLLVTFLGLTISAATIRDSSNAINNFAQFTKHFKLLLREIRSNKSKDYKVRIMAYTPLPGNLGLRDSRGGNDILDTYADLELVRLLQDSATYIEIMCLDEATLETWMKGFVGKRVQGGVLTKTDIGRLQGHVEQFLKERATPFSDAERVIHPEDADFADNNPPIRGGIKDLPSYFAYFTNERAIIINALFNPILGVDPNQQSDELKNTLVQIVGFETTDHHTIRSLWDDFNLRKERIRPRRRAD